MQIELIEIQLKIMCYNKILLNQSQAFQIVHYFIQLLILSHKIRNNYF